jgi:hypothetical protein
MRTSRSRVAILALGLAVIGTLVLHVSNLIPSTKHTPTSVHWIGLPSLPMDASSYDSRRVLMLLDGSLGNGGNRSMFRTCGDESDEAYVAYWSDEAWTSVWRAALTVHGDRIEVVAGEVLPNRFRPDDATHVESHHAWYSRRDLEALTTEWRTLWDAPRGEAMCMDDSVLAFEACVTGRYAAREFNCTGHPQTALSAARLREQLMSLLAKNPDVH